MAKVSISEAARLADIARSNLYTTYIKKGRISVSKDDQGKKFIDTSELVRVFPDINLGQQDSLYDLEIGHDETLDLDNAEQLVRNAELEAENRLLREQLEDMKEQRTLDRDQIKHLSMRLLEHQSLRRWWQFWK